MRLECQYYSGPVIKCDGFPSLFISEPDEKPSRSWIHKNGTENRYILSLQGRTRYLDLAIFPNTSPNQPDSEYRYRLCAISDVALLNSLFFCIIILGAQERTFKRPFVYYMHTNFLSSA